MDGLVHALEPPKVFRDHDQQATPSQLQEWAQYVASEREFVSEKLLLAAASSRLIGVMQTALEDEVQDRIDSELAGKAGYMINRGFAAQERMAAAKLSQAESMVQLRAGRLQVERLSSLVKQLEHVHREWRAAEFTLDRMIRLTQLRLQLSET